MIKLSGIVKEYHIAGEAISVLKGIDLAVREGDFLSIMGPSGSGKSSLLHILGCLDRPARGTYLFDRMDVCQASDKKRSHLRANHIGFVFQTFNLIPSLNLFENVELPFLYADIENSGSVKERVMAVIEQVGLGKRVKHRPSELSGGEMQRTAIARAAVMNPKLILADEPTGNLDSDTGKGILELFHKFHARGTTIIMVTHDRDVASRADTRIVLKDGMIEKPAVRDADIRQSVFADRSGL